MAEKKNVNEATTVEVDMATGEVMEHKASGIPTVGKAKQQLLEDDGYEIEMGNDDVLEGDALLSGLVLTREKLKPREKGAKPIYTYNVYGVIRGVEVRAGMNPPDKGGFSVLSLVFGDTDALPLYMVPYEMKDENGVKISGNTYKVMSLDEEGDVLECKVKPSRDSDKRILECLLKKAQKA